MGGASAGTSKRRGLASSLVAVVVVGFFAHEASAARRPATAIRTATSETRAAQVTQAGQAALDTIQIPWRELLPGWRVEFRTARSGYLALTFRTERRIEVYVRPDRPVASTAHDIAHELGHAIDVTYNDASDRERYLELRGLPADTPWWTCDACTDMEVGAGDFAETFALWAAPRYRFYSKVAATPTDEELNAIAAALFPATTAGSV